MSKRLTANAAYIQNIHHYYHLRRSAIFHRTFMYCTVRIAIYIHLANNHFRIIVHIFPMKYFRRCKMNIANVRIPCTLSEKKTAV